MSKLGRQRGILEEKFLEYTSYKLSPLVNLNGESIYSRDTPPLVEDVWYVVGPG